MFAYGLEHCIEDESPEQILILQTHCQQLSWAMADVGPSGEFAAGCTLCKEFVGPRRGRGDPTFVNFKLTRATQIKPSRFKCHHESKEHRLAMLKFLNLQADADAILRKLVLSTSSDLQRKISTDTSGPSKDAFTELYRFLRRGLSIRDGCPGVAAKEKANRMFYCLAEGVKSILRDWLRSGVIASLLRDERQWRLLVRFRCSNDDCEVFDGI